MNITKIRAFRIPLEYKRQDRWVQNVETKLTPYHKEDFDTPADDQGEIKYSYELASTTEGIFTFQAKTRFNYIAVESDLFDKTVSYWFLNEVAGVESDDGIRYEAKLDVFATYGEDLLKTLKGRTIEVDRMHQDRYNFVSGDANSIVAEINTENIALLKSDFQSKDMLGQDKTFQPALDTNRKYLYLENYTTPEAPIQMDNSTSLIDPTVWYCYAIIELTGSPNKVLAEPFATTGQARIQELEDYVLRSSVTTGIDNLRVFAPVTISAQGTGIAVNPQKSLIKLPQGKIANIVLSPIILGNTSNDDRAWVAKDENTFNPNGNDPITGTELIDLQKSDPDNQLIYFFIGGKGTEDLEIPNWNNDLTRTFTNVTKQELLDKLTTVEGEAGLYNPQICPLTLLYKGISDFEVTVDIKKYLETNVAKVSAEIDGQGILVKTNISNHQYYVGDSASNLNVVTDSGANYINENRQQIEANKEGVRLQGEYDKRQQYISRAQSAANAANPVSGLFSLFTGTVSSGISSAQYKKQMNTVDDIADNNIRKIDAAITDAAAHAPSVVSGSGNSNKMSTWGDNINSQTKNEYVCPFTWRYVKPPKSILYSMYQHYNKYGYKAGEWIDIPNEDNWFYTRRKFNYLQIKNIKDFYNGELDIDNSIVSEFEAEFATGIRIWHQNTVEYDNENYEKWIEDLN